MNYKVHLIAYYKLYSCICMRLQVSCVLIHNLRKIQNTYIYN